MSDEEIYKSDLELSFDEKFIHFHAYCVQKKLLKKSPLKISNILWSNDLYTAFPNVDIAQTNVHFTAVKKLHSREIFLLFEKIKIVSSFFCDRRSSQ